MIVRIVLAVVVVFVVWSALDYVMHDVLLSKSYEEMKDLWRGRDEMKLTLIAAVTAVVSICFVSIYAFFTHCRCAGKGVIFGLLWGTAAGVSMGFGTYATMRVPLHLGVIWCLGTIVKCAVAGFLVGILVVHPKPPDAETDATGEAGPETS